MATLLVRSCCPRVSQVSLRLLAKKAGPLRKAPPPPPKYRTVCRYVFPYPKCIDLFSLRPEPQCIESGAACGGGSLLWLLAGAALVGIGAYMSYTLPVQMLWYSFDDEDDCCDEDE